jgi:hypothetical protein
MKSNLSVCCTNHGLTQATWRRAGLRYVSQSDATKILGYPARAGGVLIPYFDRSGNQTDTFRLRYDDYSDPWAKVLGTKPQRYAQRKDSGVHIYWPPLRDWQNLPEDMEVLFTEGEFKAMKAMQERFPTIGLGGVTMWHLKGERCLHPDLAQIDWTKHPVVIVFDSDASEKALVKAQEYALTAALIDAGAHVKTVCLPLLGREIK